MNNIIHFTEKTMLGYSTDEFSEIVTPRELLALRLFFSNRNPDGLHVDHFHFATSAKVEIGYKWSHNTGISILFSST